MLVSDSDSLRWVVVMSIVLFHCQHQSHFVIVLMRDLKIRLVCLNLLMLLHLLMLFLRCNDLTGHQITSLINFHRRLTIHCLPFVVLSLLSLWFRRCRLLVMLLNHRSHYHLMMLILLIGINNFVLYVNFDCWNERFLWDFVLDDDLTTVWLDVFDVVEEKVKALHALDERHGFLESTLFNPVRHLFWVSDRFTLPIAFCSMRSVDLRRFCFVDLIFLQERIGIPADVLKLVEDDEIRVAVGADDFRERVVWKYLHQHQKKCHQSLDPGTSWEQEEVSKGIRLSLPQCSLDLRSCREYCTQCWKYSSSMCLNGWDRVWELRKNQVKINNSKDKQERKFKSFTCRFCCIRTSSRYIST